MVLLMEITAAYLLTSFLHNKLFKTRLFVQKSEDFIFASKNISSAQLSGKL